MEERDVSRNGLLGKKQCGSVNIEAVLGCHMCVFSFIPDFMSPNDSNWVQVPVFRGHVPYSKVLDAGSRYMIL